MWPRKGSGEAIFRCFAKGRAPKRLCNNVGCIGAAVVSAKKYTDRWTTTLKVEEKDDAM
jgi:hypothetical protein